MTTIGKVNAPAHTPWSRAGAWLGLWLVLATPVAALNPDEKSANYIAAHWDSEDGLPHNSIKQLFQTRDGYLWIATQQGLARFDGLTFTNFNRHNTPAFTSNTIASMAETSDGSLWIGTSAELVRYLDGRFTAYRKADGLKSATINSVCVAPDGSLWIGGREGVIRWVGGKFVDDIDTSAFDTFGMRNITVDRQHAIWLAIGTGALRYQDGAFTSFGPAQGLPAQQVQMISEAADGRIIAVTQQGLFQLDGDHFVAFAANDRLSSLQISRTLVDQAGNLWVGSVGGLDRWHQGSVVPYVDRDGNKLGVVDAVLEDREGGLWVGTSGGLFRLTNRRAHSLAQEDGFPGGLVLSLSQTRDGSLWVSSWGDGVTRFHDGASTRFTAGSPLSSNIVTIVYEAPDGTMWFGNRGSSLDRLAAGKVTTYVYQSGVASNRPVTALFTDSNGTLLVGIGNRGLLQVQEGEIVPVPESDALATARATVWSIFRTADGRLLLGTSVGVYQRRADRTWQPVEFPTLKGPVVVRDFLELDGALWLATDGYGLVRWKNGETRSYGSRHGMVDDTLFSVVDDGQGALWVSSARGLARINQGDFGALDRGAIARVNSITFGRIDGLLSASTPGSGSPSAIRLTDGRLLTATDKGVAVIAPRSLPMNQRLPTVVIEGILADEQPRPTTGTEVTLAAGTSKVEIRYTALSLLTPQRLRFRYKLDGVDDHWVEAGYARSARYTHLPPGRYAFQVLASNNDGVWNETGASLAVTMLPYYYQTLWFRLAMIALLGAAIASLLWLRTRQLNHRQRELTRMNAELDQRVRNRTAELVSTHQNLVAASRMAGMAEVATGVLHNVGNVLNSVNVSATLVAEQVRRSKLASVAKLAALIGEHAADLPAFLTQDPRGRMIPDYLATLKDSLAEEQAAWLAELDHLRKNIEHIKDIVAMQQNYAKNSGFIETVPLADLVEDALRMNASALLRHDVELVRDYQIRPLISTDKHKVVQILLNLVRNAKYACDETGRPDKRIVVRITGDARWVRVSVADNGVGIPEKNLDRVFNHGFTTKKDGHGFGLHSGALAAKELGGALTVASTGTGQGATFILELPFKPVASSP